MKTKKAIAKKTQEILKTIAFQTVGRSIPWGIYEKRIDNNFIEGIEKMKKDRE